MQSHAGTPRASSRRAARSRSTGVASVRAGALVRLVSAAWLLSAGAPLAAQLAAWPAGAGTEIGHAGQPGGLPAGFESSGAVWHPGRNRLLVVSDNGLLAELPTSGGATTTWPLAGDLEAVTLADPASSLVYVGVEQPDGVVEFDLATGLPTGNAWNLTPWMTAPGNDGLEALTWVDGVFVAGQQLDGRLFRFVLGPGGSVQFLGSQLSHLGRTDLADLHYDACSGVLYAIHDQANVIVEYDALGNFLREYALAGTDQEGVALVGGSPGNSTVIVVAQDTGEVVRYEAYPVAPCAPGSWDDLGGSTPGVAGAPRLVGSGPLQPGWPAALDLLSAPPSALLLAWLSFAPTPQPALGGTLHVLPFANQFLFAADAGGSFHVSTTWPAGVPSGTSVWFQFVVQDASVRHGLTLSNALRATAP